MQAGPEDIKESWHTKGCVIPVIRALPNEGSWAKLNVILVPGGGEQVVAFFSVPIVILLVRRHLEEFPHCNLVSLAPDRLGNHPFYFKYIYSQPSLNCNSNLPALIVEEALRENRPFSFEMYEIRRT